MGRVAIVVGALVLLVWIPIRQRPGLGTVSNVIVLGLVFDATVTLVGDAPVPEPAPPVEPEEPGDPEEPEVPEPVGAGVTSTDLRALADFNDPGVFADTMAMTLTDQVRSQDAPFVVRKGLINRERGADAWTFVEDHWDAIGDRLPSNSIARLLEGVRWLDDPAVAARVTAFLEAHPVPQGAKTIAQHLERLRVNVALRERESARLVTAFGG